MNGAAKGHATMSKAACARRVGGWCASAICAVAAAWSPVARADVASAGDLAANTNLSLTEAVTLALRDNPDLASARAKWEAMQERPDQARALPNPMFKYSGMDAADGGRWPSTDEKRFMIEQAFPWFGKRDLREGIARKDAEIMQRELEGLTRDVAMMVKESFFDLYAVQHAAGITRKEEDVLRRMSRIAETFYTTGQRTEQDVLKAKSEITMLQQRLLELAAQENTLKAKLNALLNRRADASLGALAAPPPALDEGPCERLFGLAAKRPEVRTEEARVARYDLERQLMAKESRPDYRLGLEYRRIGTSDDMIMFTVGVDLPIWSSSYEAGVREAEKMKASSEAAQAAAERRSALDVQDAGFKLQTARRTLDLYRKELIPQAEARFRASEADYQTGKVDFMDLLESERFLLSARVMDAMEEGNLGMQAARLERAVGVELVLVAPPATETGK